jgi:hypothetical protein
MSITAAKVRPAPRVATAASLEVIKPRFPDRVPISNRVGGLTVRGNWN